jgi:hypothetical protein
LYAVTLRLMGLVPLLSPTLMLMVALPSFPAASMTAAVIVWFPSPREAVNDPPRPISPSRLEVQIRLPVRSPSSASAAVPENVIASPLAKVAPSAGLVMLVDGGLSAAAK